MRAVRAANGIIMLDCSERSGEEFFAAKQVVIELRGGANFLGRDVKRRRGPKS